MGQSQSAAPPEGIRELVTGVVYELQRPPPGQPIEVELVFMHGLQLGDYKEAYWKTWRTQDEHKTCWPQLWFQEKYPKARIVSLGYNSAALSKATMKNMNPKALCENLLENMVAPNAVIGQNDCPVIFVCHSLGGLMAKQIAVCAAESTDTKIQRMLNNIKAFFFFATPHSGSKLVESKWVQLGKLITGIAGKESTPVVDFLKVLNDQSKTLYDKFISLQMQKFKWRLYVVAEGKKTNLKGIFGEWVVEKASAKCGHETNFVILEKADHFTVCKPKTKEDGGFQHLMKCIDEVHDDHDKCRKVMLSSKFKAFGVESQLQEIRSKLENKDKKVSIVGLVGMGGVGKTTLAKLLHDSQVRDYKKSYLGGVASRNIQDVQKQLYCDLFPGDKVEKIERYHLNKIKECLEKEKAFVVVDDVEVGKDTLQELQLLEGMNESKVIVTCRNEEVLKEYGVDPETTWIFKVQGIKDNDHSDLKLFCHYAFDGVQDQQVRDKFKEVAKDIVDHCEGLPLTLEVMGKYLCVVNRNYHGKAMIRESMERWKEALQRLYDAQNITRGQDDRLWSCLKISYDELGPIEQEVFLVIACIPPIIRGNDSNWLYDGSILWKREMMESVWSRSAIDHLIDRSLIKVHEQHLTMHNQLRDMGQFIISKPDSFEPMHLWESSKIMRFLKANKSSIPLRGLSLVGDKRGSFGMWGGRVYDEDNDIDEKCMAKESCIAHEALKQNVSKHYSQLVLLHLSSLCTPHVVDYCLFKCLEEKLRYLCLENSVITNKGIQRIWSLIGLRVLHIINCSQLQTIPPSLGNLTNLVEFEIVSNNKLKIIKGLSTLCSLCILRIKGCNSLEDVSFKGCIMDSLQELYIGLNAQLQTIKGLSNLRSLHIFRIESCDLLKDVSFEGCVMDSLQELYIGVNKQFMQPSQTQNRVVWLIRRCFF